MDEPLYDWEVVRPRRGPGEGIDLVGAPAGPAGLSSVELPDGSVWAVDHAAPGRLVTIEVPGPLLDSPLVLDAFGGDGVLFLLEALKRGDRPGAGIDRSRFRSRPFGPADATGRLLVLADLAGDEDLGSLAQLAASAELAAAVHTAPGGSVLTDLAGELVAAGAALGGDVDELEVRLLDRRSARRLGDLLRRAAGSAPLPSAQRSALDALADRLGRRAAERTPTHPRGPTTRRPSRPRRRPGSPTIRCPSSRSPTGWPPPPVTPAPGPVARRRRSSASPRRWWRSAPRSRGTGRTPGSGSSTGTAWCRWARCRCGR